VRRNEMGYNYDALVILKAALGGVKEDGEEIWVTARNTDGESVEAAIGLLEEARKVTVEDLDTEDWPSEGLAEAVRRFLRTVAL
jgi:hypothetical protein